MKYFVTGTDTDIGKTFISGMLCKSLKAKYYKPIQTGNIKDSEIVARLSGCEIIPESYFLKDPLSPHLAARNDGIKISVNKILQDYNKIEGDLIVEGAGGILVPINDDYLMVDLIKMLNIPVILVSQDKLGTINHTLLTIDYLRLQNIEIKAIIMNKYQNKNNSSTIKQYSGIENIILIPFIENFDNFIFPSL